jgi:hypothetical protein
MTIFLIPVTVATKYLAKKVTPVISLGQTTHSVLPQATVVNISVTDPGLEKASAYTKNRQANPIGSTRRWELSWLLC